MALRPDLSAAGGCSGAGLGRWSQGEGVQVRFFGEFEAVAGGVPVPVRGAKQRTVLALLALHRGEPVSADRLIDVLWGDRQVANPVNALQAQIGQLRRTLGATAILTSGAGYALDIGPDDVDAARFEQLVAKGRRLLEEGETALASATLGEALRLRRGEPLAEFAYAGFADAERAHLAELEALCREHPLRERLWGLLMLALYRAGRQAEPCAPTPKLVAFPVRAAAGRDRDVSGRPGSPRPG